MAACMAGWAHSPFGRFGHDDLESPIVGVRQRAPLDARVGASGGLKATGHPIGTTGVSMHVLAGMQLCGEAGAMQVPNASLAGVFNVGGSAAASHVGILEAAK